MRWFLRPHAIFLLEQVILLPPFPPPRSAKKASDDEDEGSSDASACVEVEEKDPDLDKGVIIGGLEAPRKTRAQLAAEKRGGGGGGGGGGGAPPRMMLTGVMDKEAELSD